MQNEETGTSLRDMFVYCFLHWRSAIVIVLCGIIVGGGYYAMRSYKASTATVAAVDETTETTTDFNAASDAQKSALAAQYNNLVRTAEYYQSSPLMNIDPMNEAIASATVMVSVGGDAPANALKTLTSSYASQILASTKLDELAGQMDTTPAYLRELVSIKDTEESASGTSAQTTPVASASDDQTESQGSERLASFVITVKGIDSTQATQVRDALLSDLDNIHDQIAASTLSHAMETANLVEYTKTDTSLLNQQTTMAVSVSTAQTNITTAEKNLTTASSKASSDSSSTTPSSGGISKKAVIKGALLGSIGFFLFYGFVLCLRYVTGKSPKTRAQLECRYALPEVGNYSYGDAKFYKHNTGLDRWLRGLAKMDDVLEASEVTEMVVANVRLYAGDAKKVLISSSVNSTRAKELCDGLGQADLSQSFELANRLVASPVSREQLKGADAVIFVEEYGKSTFDQIDSELSLCADANKKALGVVMA